MPPFLQRLNSNKSLSSSPTNNNNNDKSKSPPTLERLQLSLPSPSLMDDRTILLKHQLDLNSNRHHRSTQSSPLGHDSPKTTNIGRRTLALASPWEEKPNLLEPLEDQDQLDQDSNQLGHRDKEEKERTRLSKTLLSIEETIALIKECGRVIRQRGLTTLGLFRPFRAVESPNQIRNLAIKFLQWSRFEQQQQQQFQNEIEFDARDIFSARETKFDKLEKFRKELASAGIHDVVGVLKWGIRRIKFTRPFGGTSSRFSVDWYHSFMSTSQSLKHPTNAYNTILLPKLDMQCQQLLNSTLELIQHVVAFTDHNAMTPIKLCRTFGLYIFGLAPRDRQWSNWFELEQVWSTSGLILLNCLKSYLKNQKNLPIRLKDLIKDFPLDLDQSLNMNQSIESNQYKRKTLVVEMESTGEWIDLSQAWNGFVESSSKDLVQIGRYARRMPLEVLTSAFNESNHQPLNATKSQLQAWQTLKDKGKSKPLEILSEENERIFELVENGQTVVGMRNLQRQLEQNQDDSTNNMTNSNKGMIRNTPPRTTRNRSYSMSPQKQRQQTTEQEEKDSAWTGQTSPTKRWFPPPEQLSSPHRNLKRDKSTGRITGSKSVNDLYNQQQQSSSPVTNWNEFATTGFSETSKQDIKLSSPGSEEFPIRSKRKDGEHHKRTKAKEVLHHLSPRKDKVTSTTTSNNSSVRPVHLKPSTKLNGISIIDLDEDFVDTWFDTLNDVAACACWPSGIVAELRSNVVEQLCQIDPPLVDQENQQEVVTLLLITEQLVSTKPTSILKDSPRKRTPSVAESTMSMRWVRRASSIFGVNKSGGIMSGSGQDGDRDLGSNRDESPDPSPRKNRQALFAAQLNHQQRGVDGIDQNKKDDSTNPNLPKSSSSSLNLLNFKQRRRKSNVGNLGLENDEKHLNSSFSSSSSPPPPPPLPSDKEIERMELRASSIPLVAIMNPSVIPVDTDSTIEPSNQQPISNGKNGDKLDLEMERVKHEAELIKNDPSLMTVVEAALDTQPDHVKKEQTVVEEQEQEQDINDKQDQIDSAKHVHSKKALAALTGGMNAVAESVSGSLAAIKRKATNLKDQQHETQDIQDESTEILNHSNQKENQQIQEEIQLEAPKMLHTESQSTLEIKMLESKVSSPVVPTMEPVQADNESYQESSRNDGGDKQSGDQHLERPSRDTVRGNEVVDPSEVASANVKSGEPALAPVATTTTTESDAQVTTASAIAAPVEKAEQPTIVATSDSPLPNSPPLQSIEFSKDATFDKPSMSPSSSPRTQSSSRMTNLMKSLSGPLVAQPSSPKHNNNLTTLPGSPTPSNASNKSTSRKMMASMNGLLRRKKSTYEEEIEKQQQQPSQDQMKLKPTFQSTVQNKQDLQLKPEVVSNVKKRVDEIEAANSSIQNLDSTSNLKRMSINSTKRFSLKKNQNTVESESPIRNEKSPARRLSNQSFLSNKTNNSLEKRKSSGTLLISNLHVDQSLESNEAESRMNDNVSQAEEVVSSPEVTQEPRQGSAAVAELSAFGIKASEKQSQNES
ncbi:hypothetical protein OIO90_006376 [Microbotryomycetes sp. JL221]|nr:hypothetical protein OIO90_006376 [Microbotryomycetes sp. JL221]